MTHDVTQLNRNISPEWGLPNPNLHLCLLDLCIMRSNPPSKAEEMFHPSLSVEYRKAKRRGLRLPLSRT